MLTKEVLSSETVQILTADNRYLQQHIDRWWSWLTLTVVGISGKDCLTSGSGRWYIWMQSGVIRSIALTLSRVGFTNITFLKIVGASC